MTGSENDYPLLEIKVSGGTAGEFALTEDLERAAWALERTGHEVEAAVYYMQRAEMTAAEAIPHAIAEVRPQVIEAQSTIYKALVQVGGFDGMADEMQDISGRIAAVGKAYEEAEANAYQGVSGWTQLGRGLSDFAALSLWGNRMVLGTVWRFMPVDAMSRIGGWEGISSWIRPDSFPRTTGLVNRSTTQALGQVLDVNGALPYSPYDGMLWTLGRGTSILESMAGEPNYLNVYPVLGVEHRPQARGVADLVQGIIDTPYGDHGGVTIDTITHEDGTVSHVVNIPGTRDTTLSDPSPNDWNSNFYVTGNEDSDAAKMVRDAMAAADIGPDDAVMLSGHSQGGGVAAYNVASEFADDYNITHVVAFGAAPDRIDVVGDIEYLQVMTAQDITASGDAMYPADLPNVTAVEVDLLAAENPQVRQLGDAIDSAHSLVAYKEVGKSIDGSTHLSLQAWKDSTGDFLGDGDVTRRLYEPVFDEPWIDAELAKEGVFVCVAP